MIELDSPAWGQLKHAYGTAEDMPALLHQLAENPRPTDPTEEPWFTLWSSLCHQGDVYEASYAAVPHIVEIGIQSSGPIAWNFFMLPACIEIGRVGRPRPPIPDELAGAYFKGLERLHECAFVHTTDAWNSDMTQCVAAALAAAKGHIELATLLIRLEPGHITRLIAEEW